MKTKAIIKWAFLLLGVPLLIWIVMGSLIIRKESQRMETRHEAYRTQIKKKSLLDWKSGNKAWLTWTCKTPEHIRYEIFLFDDREYLVTVWGPGGSDYSGPDRFASGRASSARWQALQTALKVPEVLEQRGTATQFEPRVSIKFGLPDAKGGFVSFDYDTYAAVLPQAQLVDECIAELIVDSDLIPPRRYARIPQPVSYGTADIPNLIRGLETDRAVSFPHIVGQLAAIGGPALPELERVLTEANPDSAAAQQRIESVLKGLEAFPESHARMLPKVREIAAVTHANPRLGPLVKGAADFVEDVVVREFQKAALLQRGFNFTLPDEPPPTELRQSYEAVYAASRGPGLRDREELAQALEAMGAEVLPLILESLFNKPDPYKTGGLIDALGGIGGPDPILFALHEDAFETKACVRPLVRLGERGIPALLFLMEHGEKYTGSEIVSAFHRNEIYRVAHPQVLDMMVRQRKAYREATEADLQLLHREGVRNLINLLMAWEMDDPQSIQHLLETAVDVKQHSSIRSAALNVLRRIGAPAASGVVDTLKEQAGYEAGAMRSDFVKTITSLDGAVD